ITWLLFGVYEILRRRPVRIRTYWRTIAAVSAIALVPSLLFVDSNVVSNSRYFMRIGIPALISSVAYFVASYAFWQSRNRRRGVGFTMIAVSFFLYAAEAIHRFAISAAWSFFNTQPAYVMYDGYLDFLLQAVMGMSMIACLLEDEREATELA